MSQITIKSKKYGSYIVLYDSKYKSLVQNYTWRLKKTRKILYVQTTIYKNSKKTSITMHQLFHPNWKIIDHINGNGLDNRDINLRQATHKQNCQNAQKHIKKSSKYKGVYFHQATKRWGANIKFGSKQKQIGRFQTEIEAAKAYDQAARTHFGEFAKLNLVYND